jgi:hypothetical protein
MMLVGAEASEGQRRFGEGGDLRADFFDFAFKEQKATRTYNKTSTKMSAREHTRQGTTRTNDDGTYTASHMG